MSELSDLIAGRGFQNRVNPRKFVSIGDSRDQSEWYDYPNKTIHSSRSFITVANALMGNRLVTANYGVSGDTTDNMLSRIDAAASEKARYGLIIGGVNDIGNGTGTDATAFANIKTMADKFASVGTEPVLTLDPGSQAFTAAQLGLINDLNERLLELAEKSGYPVFDLRSVMLATGAGPTPLVMRAGLSLDGLHPNLRGHFAAGRVLASLLERGISALPLQPTSGTESRPNGGRAIFTNSMFYNLTGGILGTGVTLANGSTIPNGFTVIARGTADATAIVSNNALADGTRELVLTITSTNTATPAAPQAISLEQAFTATDFAQGDIFQGGAEISIDAGSSMLTGVTTFVRYNVGAGIVYDMYPDVNAAKDNGTLGNDAMTYTTKTPNLTIAAAPTEVSWYTRAYFAGAGSATVRIRKPWARKRFA